MFDYINSEQVKCFSCNLDHFTTGDIVPFKTDSYDYSPNFIILDCNLTSSWFYGCTRFVAHVIKDGKVFSTTEDDIDDKHFTECRVIDKYGARLNIHSKSDILQYISDYQMYEQKYDEANAEYENYFRKAFVLNEKKCQLDKNSEKYKTVLEEIDKCHTLMCKINKKNETIFKELREKYLVRWRPE